MKDKILELRKLRGNIISMSPKTVSSRCSFILKIASIPEMEEIDFTDEEAFKKQEILMIEKEKKYEEEKNNKKEISDKKDMENA